MRRCNARCYNSHAPRSRCRCSCGGRNHGSGMPMMNSSIGGGERLRANIGATSYTKPPATELNQFDANYFESEEFQGFRAYIEAGGEESRDVQTRSFTPAMGVWQNDAESPVEYEPSASIWIEGSEEDVTQLAKEAGGKYKQRGMMIVIPDAHGPQRLYTIDIKDEELVEAIATMRAFDINGGRYVEGRLEIADATGDWQLGIAHTARRLGKPLTAQRARITFLSGGLPEEGEVDYYWTGPRETEGETR